MITKSFACRRRGADGAYHGHVDLAEVGWRGVHNSEGRKTVEWHQLVRNWEDACDQGLQTLDCSSPSSYPKWPCCKMANRYQTATIAGSPRQLQLTSLCISYNSLLLKQRLKQTAENHMPIIYTVKVSTYMCHEHCVEFSFNCLAFQRRTFSFQVPHD